jgi:hypothetical protein
LLQANVIRGQLRVRNSQKACPLPRRLLDQESRHSIAPLALVSVLVVKSGHRFAGGREGDLVPLPEEMKVFLVRHIRHRTLTPLFNSLDLFMDGVGMTSVG